MAPTQVNSVQSPIPLRTTTRRAALTAASPTELLQLDPEPAHAKWEYYESQVAEGQAMVPEFHCFMLRGGWWVVDIDRERGMYQQVAALGICGQRQSPHIGAMAALSLQGVYESLTSEFQPFDLTGLPEKVVIVYLQEEPTSGGYAVNRCLVPFQVVANLFYLFRCEKLLPPFN